MNILFIFGGALTARQEKAMELAEENGDLAVLSSHVPYDYAEYDQIVYGRGIDVSAASNAVAFDLYAADVEAEVVKPKAKKKSKVAADFEKSE